MAKRVVCIPWSDHDANALRIMWEEKKLTSGQIESEFMGRYTRNAIMSKVRRMGLSSRPRVIPSITKKVKKARDKKPKSSLRRTPIDATTFTNALPPHLRPDPLNLHIGDVWNQVHDNPPVGQMERTGCKWPIGDDRPYLFCNHEIQDGSPYCPHHHSLAHRKPNEGERNAVRALRRNG